MDKHIRDAADNNRHGFEENSWEKMLPLLDEHLPQEKKRRRFIIFWFTGLAIAIGMTGILFTRQQSFTNDKKVAEQTTGSEVETKQDRPGIISPAVNKQESLKRTSIAANEQDNNTSNKNVPYETLTHTGGTTTSLNQQKNTGTYLNNKKPGPISIKKENKSASQPARSLFTKKNSSAQENQEDISINQQAIITGVSNPVEGKEKEERKDIASNKETLLPENDSSRNGKDLSAVVNKSIEDSIAGMAEQPVKPEIKSLNKSSKFSINISFGPDLSAVGTQPGNWQMQYGIGIGYAVSRHIILRTGFYVGRKVYAADSTSYKTPYNNLYNYFFLQRIDANCLVYEIPVTVAYNVIRSAKKSLFISTGLSSYLMKKEDYEYYYKAPSGNRQTHSYSYSRNSHLFSVINLSAGYQYHFSNRLSVIAEPYIKVPVTGIGNGKVNLNSGGVLFTVGFKPFGSKQPGRKR